MQLFCAYQPRTGMLHVEGIDIGDGVLIGAHSVLAPGARVVVEGAQNLKPGDMVAESEGNHGKGAGKGNAQPDSAGKQ